MKKILALLLTFVLCFAFCGCVTTQGSEHESKTESEPLVEMQEIQPAGTVNLAEDLALFDAILANNYINVDIVEEFGDMGRQTTINAKRTKDGYDVIFKSVRGAYQDVFYYIDGKLVRGSSHGETEFEYMLVGEGNFVDVISSYNELINSQTEAKLIYHVLKPIIHKFEGFKQGAFSRDFSVDYYNAVDLLKRCRSDSVYEFVLSEILKVDPTDEEATAKIKADILDFCSGNPSLAVFVDRIEEYLNTKLDDEHKIDIKTYLNNLQQTSGITTQEFVDLAKEKFPAISDNLRVAEDGETFYDYLRSYLRVISLNMFTQNVLGKDATFVEFVDSMIEASKNITVEDACNYVISHTIIKSSDENGNIIIGNHVEEFVTDIIDWKAFLVNCEIKVDNLARPTQIVGGLDFHYEQGIVSGKMKYFVTVNINYKKADVKFELPKYN